MQYDLSHLTQESTYIFGPIQDDEALLLFALIKCMGLRYIVEIGGLHGYSARNFLKAVNNTGMVITIDPSFVFSPNILTNSIRLDQFKYIIKYAHEIDPDELNIPRIDLLFLDAHDFESQMVFFRKHKNANMITDNTIIVLHDTGTHPYRRHDDQIHVTGKERNNNGYFSPALSAERQLSNALADDGYCPLHICADNNDLPHYIELRHGLTILHKPYKLLIS